MDRWIRTYPKIFDKKECDGLIEYFEAAKDHHEETRMPGHRHFWELNLMDHGGKNEMNLELYIGFIVLWIDTKLKLNCIPNSGLKNILGKPYE